LEVAGQKLLKWNMSKIIGPTHQREEIFESAYKDLTPFLIILVGFSWSKKHQNILKNICVKAFCGFSPAQ